MKAQPPHRLPALDGLRALSILLVIAEHSAGTPKMPFSQSDVPDGVGTFGVRVFFVISGFLITTLLFAEHDRTGTVSLRDFYVRRTYRIFPAFYTYLAVVVMLAGFGFIQLLEGDVLAAATYTMNFHRPRAWYLGHLWSLSVEEQFYLLWPAIVLALSKRGAMLVAVLALLSAPVLRVAIWILMPTHRLGIGETFPTVFDALAAGCLLGGLRGTLSASRTYMNFSRSPLFALVPIAIALASLVPRVSFQLAVGQSVQNIGLALTVDWVVRGHDTSAARLVSWVLDAAPLAWLGRLSYSLYLWQQLFLNRTSTHWIHAFPQNLGAAFGVAFLSYACIEQPLLRLRDRRRKAL